MNLESNLEEKVLEKITKLQEEHDLLEELFEDCNCTWMKVKMDHLQEEINKIKNLIN